ncbi:aminoacyl-tRNA hydrolase [endosymbiont GvMRE of Glomus versiforme]|uniref:aminoacyl-tRNA hydrolase n=1 Tax=endosymbiont GvMRE of Glomus versiforme TaxID=2039283 RepID=UPI000ECD192E|nr:aminoacyl-tRNA hydrolase [endosymbiont GvMRE of Glomus versiforme]RHZ35567.1 Peptidyl-tRNA hydrolase [endosymbiont GvMRE of Glomus versiforme]
MKLIVGLGNPGKEYENTRHNLGFQVVEYLANKLGIKLTKKKFNGLYCLTNYAEKEFVLLEPQTYMNNSGECVSAFRNYFQIPLENVLVIYDDLALPLGKFRFRPQGSGGGHNGIKNVIELLKSNNFKRLRIGVGYDRKFTICDWVLGKVNSEEKKEIEKKLPILLESLCLWIEQNNFEKIMNKYNNFEP